MRPRRGDVRGPDRRGGERSRRVRRPGPPVHARAPALDDLPRDGGAPFDPRCSAEPDRPSEGLQVPSALPARDGGVCRPRSDRAAHRGRPARAVLAARPRGAHPRARHGAARARGDRGCRRGLTPLETTARSSPSAG